MPTLTRRAALNIVRDRLGDCKRCPLHKTRTNIVFGSGDPASPLVFMGEAPGAEEDRQGEPFVGRAGELLTRIIEAMGWTRETVYILNVLKCQPPHNRNPEPEEIDKCLPFGFDQLRTVRPLVIVTLGNIATRNLLGVSESIMSIRGKWQKWENIDVMPTFHPAFLLRQPSAKRILWRDMCEVLRRLQHDSIRSPFPVRTAAPTTVSDGGRRG